MTAVLPRYRRALCPRRSSMRMERLRVPALAIDEACDPIDGVEVVRHEFLVRDGNPVLFLDVADELQHAGGINDAECLQGIGVRESEASRLISKQEVIDDEMPQFLCIGLHEYPHRSD